MDPAAWVEAPAGAEESGGQSPSESALLNEDELEELEEFEDADLSQSPDGAEARKGRCMILMAKGRAAGQILCTPRGSMAQMQSIGSARSPKARTT